MRDYSQAAQTWRARPPVEPEEEAPADEETGSLGGHSAHSGKAQINDHTINTTASDLTSVREGEVSTIGGAEDSLLADSYEQQQLQQSRQDDQYAGEGEDEDYDDVLDPAELEMLNEEAERMKGIGNRHMANQVRRHFMENIGTYLKGQGRDSIDLDMSLMLEYILEGFCLG